MLLAGIGLFSLIECAIITVVFIINEVKRRKYDN